MAAYRAIAQGVQLRAIEAEEMIPAILKLAEIQPQSLPTLPAAVR